MASAAEPLPRSLEEAAGNGDGTYDGAKALAWLSQVLAGDRGLTEAEIREAFAVAKEKARLPATGDDGYVPLLRIVSQRDGFRRAGLVHSKAPADHPAERFSEAEMQALVGDPTLTVSAVMPDGKVVRLAVRDGRIGPAEQS